MTLQRLLDHKAGLAKTGWTLLKEAAFVIEKQESIVF